MKFKKLGNTDLDVSLICLGTMTFGEQNTQEEGFEQMDYALERGINFFDTAEMYSVPPKPETQGSTESIVGNWMKARNKRSEVIVATKACGPGAHFKYLRNGPNFSTAHLQEALEGSLNRLQTDYIDLYQLHWPERRTNCFGKLGYKHDPTDPWEDNFVEVITCLNEFVKQGKIRHWGLSNETPWGTMRALKVAEELGAPQPVSIQNPYSLLNRSYEIGMAEVSLRENAGLLAYSPLAMGTLSGKYVGGKMPANSRLALFPQYKRYSSPESMAAIDAYYDLAQKFNVNMTHMSLAFINQQEFVTTNIIGATTMAQLKENIDSIDFEVSEELYQELELIHQKYPNPAP